MSIDLTTHFGGLSLDSPVVIGACPMTAVELTRAALVTAGAGAIVLPSLFEEQVNQWNSQHGFGEVSPSTDRQGTVHQFPEVPESVVADAESYLRLVERASSQEPVPVIASLNGHYKGDWVGFARHLESSGAGAIEFNLRRPSNEECCDPHDVEDGIVVLAESISDAISIPFFLKLGRHYSSLSHLARRLVSKANGLVLFGNAPEIDISMETLQLTARWGLTEPGSVANSIESIMRVNAFCPEMPLAASSGIADSNDVAKALLAGADVVMVTSAVYRDSPEVVRALLDGLGIFMERHEMHSMEDLKAKRPQLFNADESKEGYVKALTSQPDASQIRSATRTLQCDRWGHITPAK